ncbi:MAG: hypothetical protein F6J86_30580 [Symploca sp. SIO1B1]|nr:hypothetical protein [Symploca sp. SIO1C2]NER98128.1 hypothetical protein [Symploca sp. SIO1B1]
MSDDPKLIIVIVINLSMSLLCLYVAWQLKKWGRKLRAAADAVTAAERNTYKVLHNAPKSIYKGEVGINKLRVRYQRLGELYQQLEFQLQQIRQVLVLLSLAQKILLPEFLRSTILLSGKAKGKNLSQEGRKQTRTAYPFGGKSRSRNKKRFLGFRF